MSDLLDRALEAIRARREEALRRGVELIGVFGSVARSEDGEESDVDVAYDIVGRATLLDLGGILVKLESDLGRKVDMTDISQVRPELRAFMERDLVRA